MSLKGNRALITAGAGALGILAGVAAANATDATAPAPRPTVQQAMQLAQNGPPPNGSMMMEHKPMMARGIVLQQVRLEPGMMLRGNMGQQVSPATAKLLQSLSSAISNSIRANGMANAGADYVQYGYGSSVAGQMHQELVVR